MTKYGVFGAVDHLLRYLLLQLHNFDQHIAGGSVLRKASPSKKLNRSPFGLCVFMIVNTILIWHKDSYL